MLKLTAKGKFINSHRTLPAVARSFGKMTDLYQRHYCGFNNNHWELLELFGGTGVMWSYLLLALRLDIKRSRREGYQL